MSESGDLILNINGSAVGAIVGFDKSPTYSYAYHGEVEKVPRANDTGRAVIPKGGFGLDFTVEVEITAAYPLAGMTAVDTLATSYGHRFVSVSFTQVCGGTQTLNKGLCFCESIEYASKMGESGTTAIMSFAQKKNSMSNRNLIRNGEFLVPYYSGTGVDETYAADWAATGPCRFYKSDFTPAISLSTNIDTIQGAIQEASTLNNSDIVHVCADAYMTDNAIETGDMKVTMYMSCIVNSVVKATEYLALTKNMNAGTFRLSLLGSDLNGAYEPQVYIGSAAQTADGIMIIERVYTVIETR